MVCYQDRITSSASEQVRGTADTLWTAIQHMGVDHRGLHIAVTQQLLNRADVGSLLQQVCGERMAEGVAGGWLADSRCLHGSTHTPHALKVPLQGLHQAQRQHGAPFLVSLAAAHCDAALLQVHILGPQPPAPGSAWRHSLSPLSPDDSGTH